MVSRAHAVVWCEAPGVFYVRDTRSSSGTFLNHVRLSPARVLRDGDILQFGVDYQSGTEDSYKSVKIRVEVGREWQGGRNAFNTNTLKNLKKNHHPAFTCPLCRTFADLDSEDVEIEVLDQEEEALDSDADDEADKPATPSKAAKEKRRQEGRLI
ncbi:hypothetical protein BDZ89DRAFT_1136939 [Hymenopellis radicata]|nr:hypothetical protein BDZ89DRAFT_1136939 [Hymenopellis radicata]